MLNIVGFGPGSQEHLTAAARTAILEADVVVAYKTYAKLLTKLFPEKDFVTTGMTEEVERCQKAVALAKEGQNVALVSSGDAGVYGMAGLVLSILEQEGLLQTIPFKVIPGVTAATAGAALLGAPLMNDFAVLSLSDRLTPFDLIQKRVRLAAEADLVLCIYNPRSRGRREHLKKMVEEILCYRPGTTPVGLVKNIGRADETSRVVSLETLPYDDVDMFTTVIVGNSKTYAKDGVMITPRGYPLEEDGHAD